MRRLSWILAALACASLLVGPPAAGADRYPVTYNFLPYAVVGGIGANPPGANDWHCRPSAAHPRPVVLVHGTFGNRSTNWQTYAPLLANHGYCVFALTYGLDRTGVPGSEEFGGMTRMQDSARELAAFVARVRRATGADRVDLVGHSQGTLMPDYYLKFLGGAPFVKHYISLSPLWHGTRVSEPAGVFEPVFGAGDESTPLCVACGQFTTGSSFMRKLRRGGVAVDGVAYTNIVTEDDELVVPYTSGLQKGMRNVVVQDHCATDHTDHFEMAADPVASVIVLNTLDPRHARPVPCTVVAPFVGPAPTP